jgi:3',5'-cyclic-AMP phosphodiesterase
MPRLVWLTDIHLNFASDEAQSVLLDEIRRSRPDHLLLGGDIAEAPTLVESLQWLAGQAKCPLWFVLGNHDYYRGSIGGVREQMRELTRTSANLQWLPARGIVPLTDETCLIGHGGWGDARAGNWEKSDIILNDYALINELRSTELISASKLNIAPDPRAVLDDSLRRQLNGLGDECAAHLRKSTLQALADFREVIVLMHVPPFLESCWHLGHLSDEFWAPHFVCEAAGSVLRELMAAHPRQSMTVLCGHTHSGGKCRPLDNLTVLTGEAHYSRPAVQRVFEV